ncbi:MAG TPA: hypothetical protein VGE52_12155 [Pirellulales bacterium]
MNDAISPSLEKAVSLMSHCFSDARRASPFSRLLAATRLLATCLVAGAGAFAASAALGQDSVPVAPDYGGKSLSEARQAAKLADLSLASGVYYIAPQNWRDEIRPGRVGMQTPQPRTPLTPGSVVAVWTFAVASSSQAEVKTPDLDGLSAKAALEKLQAVGLTAMRPGESSPPAASSPAAVESDSAAGAAVESEWIVVEQYPRAGQAVYEGTGVHFILGPSQQ